MNYAFLSGRLTEDPVIRYTPSNNSVVTFTLAVERAKMKEQDKAETDFIRCNAWDGAAQYLHKYARKGDKITVKGTIRTGKYTDKDGRTVYTTDIRVQRIEDIKQKYSREEAPADFIEDMTGQGVPF